MKTNTALLWMGVFTLGGAATISCGGGTDDITLFAAGTSGTTATAGTTATGGMTSTGGTTSHTAGTTNNTAGTTTNNTAGSNNNTAGTSNTGGSSNPGTGGAPGSDAGGAGPDGCPATMPADGTMCAQGDSPFQGCDYGDMNCRCRRANGGGQMRAWQCDAAQGADVVCPADAMDGDPCTGQGLCAGQQCFCNNEQTNCF